MLKKACSLIACTTLLWVTACESDPEEIPPEVAAALEPAEGGSDEGTAEGGTDEAAAEPEKAPLASIGSMEGTVTVNGEPAEAKQELAAGDEVKADEGGFADLYFGDGSKVRVKNATVKLTKAEEKSFSLELALGKLYAWITPGTEFDVAGPTAVAGVRGTKFFMEENKKEAYFCVCEGSIAVQKVAKKKKKAKAPPPETLIKAGEDLHVPKRKRKLGKPKASEKMVTMVNQEFDDIASRAE